MMLSVAAGRRGLSGALLHPTRRSVRQPCVDVPPP